MARSTLPNSCWAAAARAWDAGVVADGVDDGVEGVDGGSNVASGDATAADDAVADTAAVVVAWGDSAVFAVVVGRVFHSPPGWLQK